MTTSSTTELVGELAEEIGTLVRQELQLARKELEEQARASARGFALLGGAAAAGSLAVAAIHGGMTRAVHRRLPPVMGAALLATAYGGAGAVMATRGIRILEKQAAATRAAVQELKEDLEWARHPTTSEAR
ncbi:MAG TPA: phage holin family protein [Acidimicrobiales bacterium]|nr:phage holin family protein [Acidimicrobiales bacterium]